MPNIFWEFYRQPSNIGSAAMLLLPLITFALLIPVWYGADEEAHYAVLKYVSATNTPPTSRTYFDREVIESFTVFPLPQEKIRFWSGTFEPRERKIIGWVDFFGLPAAKRQEQLRTMRHFGSSLPLEYIPQSLNGITYQKDCLLEECFTANYGHERTSIIDARDPTAIYFRLWEFQQPPLYYYLLSLPLKILYGLGAPLRLKIAIVRLLSLIFVAAALPYIQHTMYLLTKQKVGFPSLGLILYFPTILWSLARVSNDTLTFFVGSLGACLAAHLLTQRAKWLTLTSCVGFGMLAALTKQPLFALFPVLVLAPLFNRHYPRLLNRCIVSLLVASSLGLVVMFYIALVALHGGVDLTGTYGAQPSLYNLLLVIGHYRPTFFEFIWVPLYHFGTWLPVEFQSVLASSRHEYFFLVMSIPALAFLATLYRLRTSTDRKPLLAATLLGLLALLCLYILLYLVNAKYLYEYIYTHHDLYSKYVFVGAWYLIGIMPWVGSVFIPQIDRRWYKLLAVFLIILNGVIYIQVFLVPKELETASVTEKLASYSLFP
jgi:hypothetical protein